MRRLRAAWIPAVLVLGLVATACGGGGNPIVLIEVIEVCDDQVDNDGDTLVDCDDADSVGDPACPGDLIATFTADPPSPDPRISMDPGPAMGIMFSIEINASGIPDLFGAGFTVLYDPAIANFLACESQGSILVSGGAPSNPCDDSLVGGARFFAELQNGVEGALNVRASLEGAGVPGVPVGTGLLLTLTFSANGVTSSEPFIFEGGTSQEVQECPEDLSPCSTVPAAFDGGTLVAAIG